MNYLQTFENFTDKPLNLKSSEDLKPQKSPSYHSLYTKKKSFIKPWEDKNRDVEGVFSFTEGDYIARVKYRRYNGSPAYKTLSRHKTAEEAEQAIIDFHKNEPVFIPKEKNIKSTTPEKVVSEKPQSQPKYEFAELPVAELYSTGNRVIFILRKLYQKNAALTPTPITAYRIPSGGYLVSNGLPWVLDCCLRRKETLTVKILHELSSTNKDDVKLMNDIQPIENILDHIYNQNFPE